MSYPSPNHTFKYAYMTYYNLPAYYRISSRRYITNTTVYDNISDGPNDSNTQLGDVSYDSIAGYSSLPTSSGQGHYIGEVLDKNGNPDHGAIVVSVYQSQYYNYYFILSDHKLDDDLVHGDRVKVNPKQPFDLLCFTSGTIIRLARGDVIVDTIQAGDIVTSASGEHRVVRWIGHRTVDCAAAPRPSETWPVRIRAGAFGSALPARDLFLSPGHPVLVGADEDGLGGHLVPIMCLINGTTIERVKVDAVTYWHVELDQHDILLAEGLPAESYIDLGSRTWFAGADGPLYDPDMAAPGLPGRCRPVAIDGPVVEAERRRLDAAFAMRLAAAAAWPAAEDALLEA